MHPAHTLALLLLLLAIPPGKAMRAGLGPIAAVLTIAHLRFVAAIPLRISAPKGGAVGSPAKASTKHTCRFTPPRACKARQQLAI